MCYNETCIKLTSTQYALFYMFLLVSYQLFFCNFSFTVFVFMLDFTFFRYLKCQHFKSILSIKV